MPSKTSLFNKEIILQIGRSAGWISTIYFLGLLFLLPIRILMIYSDENQRKYYQAETLFNYDFTFQIGLIAIVPVILAVFLFRFLHFKQAGDLIHSLPFKRSRIFHHYALTGAVFLIVPIVIITLILLLQNAALDANNLLNVKEIFYWAGTTLVIDLLLYSASVFVAMMTGISTVHAVLAYIFLFFPVGFALLSFYNLKFLLFGFPSDYFLNQQLEKLSPLTYSAVLESRAFQWKDTAVYLVLTLILYGLSLTFYKKRNLESASEAIAFPKLRYFFQYGVTFCTMLLAGAYFRGISFYNWGWTIFGYVIGAVLGYFVASMVLNKTWRVFGQVKGLGVYLALITIIGFGLQTLGFYENRIPAEAEISNVLLTNSLTSYRSYANGGIDPETFAPKPMKEKKNIEAVRRLHQQILKDRSNVSQKNKEQTETLFIRYELKNGRQMIREYSVNQRLYDDFFKPIYESEEYKLATAEIFKIKESKIKNINISANGPVSKAVTIAEPNEVKEAITALKQDVLSETYEDSVYFNGRGSRIEISIGRERLINLEMKPTYTNIQNWLNKKKLLDRVKVTADDIDYMLVAKRDFSQNEFEKLINNPEEILKGNPKILKVTDKSQIDQLLNKASTNPVNKDYTLVIYYKVGNGTETLFFDGEHAPNFLKNRF